MDSPYWNIPIGAPPNGTTSNFIDPITRAPEIHIAMGICIGFAAVFVILRCYVRLVLTKAWGWDDFTCLIGFVAIIGHDAITFTITGPGKWLGVHIWDIRALGVTKSYLQRTLASIDLYAVSALFVKLSLFLLYLRLFSPNRITRYLIYVGILVCVLLYSASIIINSVLCGPKIGQPNTQATWLERGAGCQVRVNNLAVVQGAFGVFSDIYLLVIPIQSVFQLHLPMKRKLGISAIFLVGLIATACSVGSLVFRVRNLHAVDYYWDAASIYIFSSSEMCAGVICSSTPILVALFRSEKSPMIKLLKLPSLRYFGSLFSKSTTANSGARFKSNENGVRSASGENLHNSARKKGPGNDWLELSESGMEFGGSDGEVSSVVHTSAPQQRLH